MEDHFGKTFGVSVGVVGGVLLGVFAHPVLWCLLPIGVGLGFLFDSRKKKNK